MNMNGTNKSPTLSVIMPALNEERNILNAIGSTLEGFEQAKVDGEIVVVNDGSTDTTLALVEEEMKKYPNLRLVNHEVNMGFGASFWDGVDNAHGEIVVCLPGDNENDPWEILRYFKLLDHVDLVIPFVFNKEVRSLFRNGLSFLYRFIINSTFTVNLNYTNGTVLYRKTLLEALEYRSSSFFFQTDILIRLIKRGYLFAEVPYRLRTREEGNSKALTFPSFMQVVRGYIRLVRDLYYTKSIRKDTSTYSEDTSTGKRYGGD